MGVMWGDELVSYSAGLDVLGVRATDQAIEAQLVNGLTTISQRGRYFTILSWAVREFFYRDELAGVETFEQARLTDFLVRVEFLTLACTELGGGPVGAGLLGTITHAALINELRAGNLVTVPTTDRSQMYDTYIGPCRALCLLGPATRTIPATVGGLGDQIWQTMCASMGEAARLIGTQPELHPDDVMAAVLYFSLNRLAESPEEAALLRSALTGPPDLAAAPIAVQQSYQRFSQTIEWLQALPPANQAWSGTLLARN